MLHFGHKAALNEKLTEEEIMWVEIEIRQCVLIGVDYDLWHSKFIGFALCYIKVYELGDSDFRRMCQLLRQM